MALGICSVGEWCLCEEERTTHLTFVISHLSLKQDRRPVTDDRKQERPCLLAVVGLLSSVALEMSNDKCQIVFCFTARAHFLPLLSVSEVSTEQPVHPEARGLVRCCSFRQQTGYGYLPCAASS